MTHQPDTWTKSRIRRLGQRLTASDPPDEGHMRQLHELLLTYDEALNTAVSAVEENLGLRITSRIKNTGTILEKLHRSGGGSLPNIQDLAGMRIVEDLDWLEQDQLVESLATMFSGGEKEPRVIDRRTAPSTGYRAVHLVVFVGARPVEIQVRTTLQHEWANLFEKLADILGRGIRYGEAPDEWTTAIDKLWQSILKSDPSLESSDLTEHLPEDEGLVAQLTQVAIAYSEQIGLYEYLRTIQRHPSIVEAHPHLTERVPAGADLDKLYGAMTSLAGQYKTFIDKLLNIRNTLKPIYEKAKQDALLERMKSVQETAYEVVDDIVPEHLRGKAKSAIDSALKRLASENGPGTNRGNPKSP